MDDSEHDVLAYMTFPAQHRAKLHSTNPLERLNKEVKRRADVVGIFPNEASITRLIGAVLLEQNDEWLLQCRYMQIEGMAELTPPSVDTDLAKLPPLAATDGGVSSSNTALISRVMLASLGKTPTTPARRMTSLFNRSNGLVECSLARCCAGKVI